MEKRDDWKTCLSLPSYLNNAGRNSEQVFANAKKERKQRGGQMGEKKKEPADGKD